jgi:oxygen-independent coproporphyrinogen-3 oxidase
MKIDISWKLSYSKYNVPVHDTRATHWFWNETDFAYQNWIDTLQKSFAESNSKEGISLTYTFPFVKVYVLFLFTANASLKIIV